MRHGRLVLILLLAAAPAYSGAASAQDSGPSAPAPGIVKAGPGVSLATDGTLSVTTTVGPQGPAGPQGASITGPQGVQGVAGTPGTVTQQLRVQTATDGTYTWTYATGVVPVVEATVEDANSVLDTATVKLDGTPTATQAKVRVGRGVRTAVPTLTITTLNYTAAPGATWVHLTARAP